MQNLEARTIGKVSRRLIPFLIICYFVAYLDRVNVGFAALTMNKALGLTATMLRLRRRHFLPHLFHLRGAVESVSRPLRRAQVDRPHHDQLGHPLRRDGVHSGHRTATGLGDETLLHPALPARRGGGRILPRHHLLSDAVVPLGLSRRIIGYFMAAIPLSTVIGAPISGLILGHERHRRPRRAGSGSSSSRRRRRSCWPSSPFSI